MAAKFEILALYSPPPPPIMTSNSGTPKIQQKSFLHYPATPTISSKNIRTTTCSKNIENDCNTTTSVPIMINLDPSERISLNKGKYVLY